MAFILSILGLLIYGIGLREDSDYVRGIGNGISIGAIVLSLVVFL